MTHQNSTDFISRRASMGRRHEPSSIWRRNQNTVAFAPSAKLGPVSHTVLVAVMVAVLGLIYLTQITKTGSYTYIIGGADGLNAQTQELATRKKELEVESAKLRSLKQIQNSEVAKTLTTPASTDYIR